MKNTLILTDKKTGGTVKLFKRQNRLNPISLYLEIYHKATQRRNLEFLGLYLTGDEIQDEINLQAAKDACVKYIITDEAKQDKPSTFTDYMTRRLMFITKEQSRENGFKALKKLQLFIGKENIPYKDIKDEVLRGFQTWLLTECINENTGDSIISRGTADVYFVAVNSTAIDAREKGYIPLNNFYPKDIKSIGRDETEPVYLSPEQIIKLQNMPMPKGKEVICRAGMLQYECGQRWSDIQNMTWEGLQMVSDKYERVFNQIKTGNLAFSAFSDNLIEWIAAGHEKTGLIFKHGRGGLPNNHDSVNKALNEWCKAAGISEHIGTHTFRRCFARHLWLNGADIYSIMQLLGHKTVKQTQKYIGTDKDKLKQTLSLLKSITDQFSYNAEKRVPMLNKAV